MTENGKEDFRLKLPPKLKSELAAIFRRRSVDRTKACILVLDWFVKQSQMIQQHILGQLPDDIEADIASMVLKKMAAGSKSAKDAERVLGRARPQDGSRMRSKKTGAA